MPRTSKHNSVVADTDFLFQNATSIGSCRKLVDRRSRNELSDIIQCMALRYNSKYKKVGIIQLAMRDQEKKLKQQEGNYLHINKSMQRALEIARDDILILQDRINTLEHTLSTERAIHEVYTEIQTSQR